jgi:hypothetical protein
MSGRRRIPAATLLALGVMAGALAGAPTASADDRSVARVFRADEGRFENLQQDLIRAHNRWVARKARRPGPVIRVLARLKRLERSRQRRLSQEDASSALGEEARERLLASLRHYIRYTGSAAGYFRLTSQGLALGRRGDDAGARRAQRRAAAAARRASRQEDAWKREDRIGKRALEEALQQAQATR